MKKIATLFMSVLTIAAVAQSQKATDNTNRFDATQFPAKDNPVIDEDNMDAYNKGRAAAATSRKGKTSGALIWSEDFATSFATSPNGAWTASGQSSNLVSQDTDGPDNLLSLGWGPLPSPTASNGFAIMDWYDNFPDPNGFATSPVEGLLTSPTIDLTGYTDVVLTFYQQLYWCCEVNGEMYAEVSTDGGTNWTQYKTNVVDRNDRHWDLGFGYYYEFNISSAIAANPANVQIRFNWTSLIADQNGQYSTAYFWMIDDIEIRELPRHKLIFESVGGAPEQDVIFDGDGANSKMGHIQESEVKPYTFDANLYNFGKDDQTGVDLLVNIYDEATGAFITSVQSSSSSTVLAGDSLDFNSLTTGPWTPQANQEYTIEYTLISDSIDPSNLGPDAESVVDSFEIERTADVMSLDFGRFGNSIGTQELGDDNSAVGSRFYWDPAVCTGNVPVFGVAIDYSTATVAGGDIIIEVYDTAGFDFTNGFGGFALISETFTLGTAEDNGDFVTYDLTDAGGNPVLLPPGGYYFVVNMYSNTGANRIAIANDQSYEQAGFSSIMNNVDQGRWFTGFADSRTFEAPIVRAITTQDRCTFSVNETNKTAELKVFPNPNNGLFNIEIPVGGKFTAELISTTGQVIESREISVNGNEKTQLDYTATPKGAYLLRVNGEDFSATQRLVIR